MKVDYDNGFTRFSVKGDGTMLGNDATIFDVGYKTPPDKGTPFLYALNSSIIGVIGQELPAMLYGKRTGHKAITSPPGQYVHSNSLMDHGRFGAMFISAYATSCKALGVNVMQGYPPFSSFVPSVVKPNPKPLTLKRLQKERIAVAFSGGMDSVALCHMLDRLGIQYDKIEAYDEFHMPEKNSDDYPIHIRKLYHMATAANGFAYGRDRVDTKYGTILSSLTSPVMRLLFAAHCYGQYDTILFGDTLEDNVLFHKDTDIVPLNRFWASQWFYNWYNEFVAKEYGGPRLEQPLQCFSTVNNIGYCLDHGLKVNSCYVSAEHWCGECGKCRRTVEAAAILGKLSKAHDAGLPDVDVELTAEDPAYMLLDEPNRALDGKRIKPLPYQMGETSWDNTIRKVISKPQMVKQLGASPKLVKEFAKLYGMET